MVYIAPRVRGVVCVLCAAVCVCVCEQRGGRKPRERHADRALGVASVSLIIYYRANAQGQKHTRNGVVCARCATPEAVHAHAQKLAGEKAHTHNTCCHVQRGQAQGSQTAGASPSIGRRRFRSESHAGHRGRSARRPQCAGAPPRAQRRLQGDGRRRVWVEAERRGPPGLRRRDRACLRAWRRRESGPSA